MNTKSSTNKSSFWAKSTALILIIMLMLLALPVASASAAPLAATAPDGQGSMTVSPTTVVYGTSTAFTFTFTPTVGDYPIGTSVELTIPIGWTAPVVLTNVTIGTGTCTLNPSWQITGRVIVVDVNECLFGQFFTISYTGTPGPVSGSPYTFTSQTDVPGGNGLFDTAIQPVITVTKKALTVTGITAADVVYGTGAFGTTLNTTLAALSGVVGVDVVSLTLPLPTTGSFTAPYTVGVNKPVTIAAITLTGADSGNYTLTQPSVTASITPKPLTVSGTTASNKPYDGGTSATVITTSSALVGNLDGSNVVLVKTGVTGVFTLDGNVGTGKTVQVSGFTISGSAAFNYTLTQPTTTANITPKALTVTGITASDKFYDATPSATIDKTGAVLVGVITADVGSVVLDTTLAAGAFTPNGNAGVGKTVQISGLTISGSAIGNYSLTQPTTTATITALSVTVTPNAGQTKVFGATDPTPFTYTHTALLGTDAITGSMGRTAGEDVGTYPFAIGTLTAGSNYSLSVAATPTFSITAKPITVTANAGQSKVFGDADPLAFAYTSSDPAATFSGALDRAAGENVGTYAIGQGNLAVVGSNYTMSFVSNNFSITAKPITVTANAGQTKVFGAADPLTFAYTSSDLAATFTGALERVAGEDVGSYAIGQGNLAVVGTNYSMSFVSNNFSITAKPITVTANAGQTKVFGDADPLAFAYTSSDLAVTFTGALDRVAGENVNSYAIGQGNLAVVGINYSMSFVSNNFSITAKPITVTPDAGQSKVFGASDPAFTYTNSAMVGTDAITGSMGRTAGENVGTYPFAIGTLTAGSNYSLSLAAQTFSITAKPITVTVDAGQTKIYGALDPTFAYTSSDPGASFTGALGRAAGEDVGTYAINQGTLSAGSNYTISFIGGNLSVTQAVLTATANNKTIIFGNPDPAFDITYSGFQFTEGQAVLNVAPTCGVSGAHAAVGTYPIVCSGGSDNNYSFSYVDGTLTVSPVPVAIFADVPLTYWANNSIERLYNSGITKGCTTIPLNYCPATPVTRAQMAIFLVRAMHGITFVPPVATGHFADVPVGSFGADFIEQLFADGITSGCSGGVNFCPATPVTRAQMAIFLVRAMHGITFVPPVATGHFADVPVGSFGADFIEQLFADGITSGCSGGVNFCPASLVMRDSMAVFLVKAFNLP